VFVHRLQQVVRRVDVLPHIDLAVLLLHAYIAVGRKMVDSIESLREHIIDSLPVLQISLDKASRIRYKRTPAL